MNQTFIHRRCGSEISRIITVNTLYENRKITGIDKDGFYILGEPYNEDIESEYDMYPECKKPINMRGSIKIKKPVKTIK